MSRPVALDETAINEATAFLADYSDGLRRVLAAIDQLTEHPYPGDSFPSAPLDSADCASATTESSTP